LRPVSGWVRTIGCRAPGTFDTSATVSNPLCALPPLEWVVSAGAFLVAVTLAVPLTLLTIAIAWLAHRPLIGGVLLVASVGSLVLLRMLHRPRAAQPA